MQRAKQTRFLAFILALVMVVGLTPISAYATETGNDVQETTTAASEEMTETAVETEDSTEAEETVDVETTEDSAEAEETVDVETTEDPIDVDAMSDGELLNYVNGLSDEEANVFFASLTEAQQERLLSIMEGVEACSTDFVSETHTVFKHTESTLAPGVEQYINYAYSSDGKQMVYYVATADISRDDVIVQTSYKEQYDNGLGMEKLTNQIAYANEKYTDPEDENYISDYYTVVAGVNGSFYNMTTGQPTGYTVIDGESFGTTSSSYPFFAILTDGTAVIDYPANADNYVDEDGNSTVWQAIAGSQWLVRDGEDVTASATGDYNTDRHSRTCVGITEDGKVVFMVLDGRQEPFSCGGSMHELAQIMLEAGCVAAINLDGGGSTTYAARQEGSDTVEVINNPSDGSERSISAGLMIASLAVPSDTFDHVTMTAEDEYVTPGTSTEISITGVSPAGSAAEVPDGVTYEVTNGTYENGVLTAGTEGDVTLTAYYEGEEVGYATIHAVVPDTLTFNSAAITVPFGKTVTIGLTASYGLNEVKIKADDLSFELSNDAIGTMDGFEFTAGNDESVTTSTITATVVGTEISAQSTINLGKGSEVIYDFEDGDISDFALNYSAYNYVLPEGSTYLVDSESGQVHSGNYALALDINYGNSLESGYMMTALQYTGDVKTFENATKLGMWIYISDEDVSTWIRYTVYPLTLDEEGNYVQASSTITTTMMDSNSSTTGVVSTFEEPGWHYLSIDLSDYAGLYLHQGYIIQFYISDRDGADFDYYYTDYKSYNGRYVMYVDDITIDYSDAVDDREAPVFGDVTYATPSMSDAETLNGQTVTSNNISFAVKVADDTTKNNYTGLDVNTAKAYIDGVEIDCNYSNGVMSVSNLTLADGVHHIKFTICDNQGNYASIIRTIDVQADSGLSTVKVVAHDPSLDKILLGSVWYADIVATDIEKIQSVTVDIDLNNMSVWELDHMEVADGFTATYSIQDDENIATITITRTGTNTDSGEGVLASLPIRTWELKMGYTYTSGTKSGKTAYTYAQFKSMKEFWPIDISMEIDRGIVVFTDGTTDTFSGEGPQVDTEMYKMCKDMISTTEGKEYYDNWDGGHIHTVTELDDKDATCTECGYTDRTYCEVCSSVVDWGTTISATGHEYDFVDDVLKCTHEGCKETYTGEWTDGKVYADGMAVADGWVGDSYYVDGVKLTGIQYIDGYYYDFGEDGVCAGQTKYTGFLEKDDGWYYIAIGTEAKGWQYIDGDYYYFDPDTGLSWYGKDYWIYSQTYKFNEQGKLLNGLWVNDGVGTLYFYGPGAYKRTWAEIDGNTYYFDNDGYRKEGISWFYLGQSNNPPTWYEFTDEGVYVRTFDETGLWEYDGELYYLIEGVNQKGLFLVDGDYYYFNSTDYTAVSGRYWVGNTNGLDIEQGYYEFDETTHKMIVDTDNEDVKNGLIQDDDGAIRYYVDGVATYAGLVQDADGNYYYINSTLQAVTGRYWVEKTNDLMDKGYYVFGDDCKMIIETDDTEVDTEKKNGLVEEDGVLYYYVNDVLTYAGLIEIDGDYYYINSTCKAVTGRYWVEKTNDLMDKGYYEFGEDGKMIIETDDTEIDTEKKNGLVEEDGVLYYYVNDVPTYAGLIEIDGDYYYINSTCKAVTGRYWVEKTNDLMDKGYYEFGDDGKMIIETDDADDTEVKNGLVEEDGNLYYYVDGVLTYAGLIEIDGDYYYINSTCKAVTGRYWVQKNNDLLPIGYYEFGSDGKMITE